MFKLVLLFACVAYAAAGVPILGYSGLPSSASGYEYTASVETPDYINHQSVSSPLAPSPAPLAYSGAIAYSGWPGAIRTFDSAPIYRSW